MSSKMYSPVSGLLIFLCLVLGLTVSLVWGQTPTRLSIGNDDIVTPGSTIPMTIVGADGVERGLGLSSLFCFTPSPSTAVWVCPDGSIVPPPPSTQVSFTAPPNTIQSRVQGSLISLHRGDGFIAPAGQYCCGSANNVNERLCVTLASCPFLVLGNGMVTYTDPPINGVHNSFTATHTCSNGYQLVGLSTRICDISGDTGTWRGADRTCNPVDCGTPPVLTNGSPGSPDMTTLGGMVTYTCDSGYAMSTGTTMTTVLCLATGMWGTPAACLPTCPDLPTLNNGVITYNPNTSPRLEGTTATHSCDTGYVLSGGTVRTCQSDGTWSGGSITCQPTCPNLQSLTNGAITYNPNTSPRLQGTTATHSCNTGYELSGGTARTCQSDRTWSGGSITCQPVDCGPPPTITNGSPGTPTSTTFGGMVTYTCIDMYILSGTGPFMCLASKMWDTPPTCLATCADLPPPENGTITYFPDTMPRLEGTIALHFCDSGYQRSAGAVRTCQSDTTWSGGDVTCLAICPDLPPLTNGGSINYSPSTTPRLEGATATYSCTDGYQLSSDITRTCEDSVTGGKWNGMEPTCLVFPLSVGGSFFVNNTPVVISDIGEGVSALMCRTELTSCCRDEDNINGGPQGEWYGPDGNKIPSVSDSQGFFISRNLSSVNLNRRVGTSQPVGSFCCVIPSAGDINETFCAAIEGPTPPPAGPGVAGVAVGIVLAIIVIIVVIVGIIIAVLIVRIRLRKLNQSADDPQPAIEPEQETHVYEDVSKLQVGDTNEQIDPPQSLPLKTNYEYTQCPAYATSSVSRQRGATQVTQVDGIYEN